jgi:hypothetical protein
VEEDVFLLDGNVILAETTCFAASLAAIVDASLKATIACLFFFATRPE